MRESIRSMFGDRLLTAFFVLSTSFFVYQHTTGISWDFTVYVLNAKYIFNNGFYMEWLRPPLMPFLLFLFSLVGYGLGEYVYIVFTSWLFGVACIKLASEFGRDRRLFYALMLSPFVLNGSLFAGTELLNISLMMLGVAYLGEFKSSVFFGLGFLARYTTLPYMIFLLFNGNLKRVIAGFAVIFLLFTPWMYYNYSVKHHPFYSMGVSNFFNMVYRSRYHTPPQVSHFLSILGLYTPFFLLGLYIRIRRGLGKSDIIMLVFAGLALFSYLSIPVKEARHLFNLVLPVGFFTAAALEKIIARDSKLVVFVVVVNFAAAAFTFVGLGLPPTFYEGAREVGGGCMVMSNIWPDLNYVGVPTQPYPKQEMVVESIREGKRILLYRFGNSGEPEYMYNRSFMESLPKLKETRDYIILGDETVCAPQEKVDESHIELYNEEGHNVALCPILPVVCST
jgi:hypothetical protein